MAYQVYATATNLAEYLGIQEANLPTNSERLLKRASELVAQATLGTIDVNKTEHAEAAQLATCAQVETWIEGGESSHITGPVKSYSLGKLSVDSGVETGKYGNQLAIRARNYLFQAGLLYRGVKMR